MFLQFVIYFFVFLLIVQLFVVLQPKAKMLEGFEEKSTNNELYKPYNMNDSNNALILAQQNAGNIEVLKGRIDNVENIKSKVDTMQQSIDSMQTQINGLVQQQSEYASEMAGSKPVEISGTEGETTESVEKENN
jgi:hypothetical protein